MGFKDELKVFQTKVIALQERDEKEIIEEDDVIRSMVILNFIKYQKVPDIFLGCASLNLLNTYVKQGNSKLNYEFRRHMLNLLKGIEDIHQDKAVHVAYDDVKKIIMFVFWDFQFSFHGERYSELVKRLQTPKAIPWDGIRKQLCAKTIFDFAYERSWLSNETLDGKNLKDRTENEVDLFLEGKYKFINGQLIKISDIVYHEDDMDKDEKNYFRKKLCDCQDRPVVMTGIFKKVWDKHVTFTTIRPYIQGCQTLTVCNHINLLRSDVIKVYDITKFEKNRRYYIIGYCQQYFSDEDRMGIKLAIDYRFPPLFRVSDFYLMSKDVFSECHRFGIDEFLSRKNRHLKL